MPLPPDPTTLEVLRPPELRALVGELLAEVGRLRSEAAALRAENRAPAAETRALHDEIARLKGLPPRPPARPSPSGMERATEPAAAWVGGRGAGAGAGPSATGMR
jgi:hypothetical protein